MVPAPLLSLQATEFSVSPALPCLGPNWKPASTVQAPTIGTPACSHSFWKSRIIAEGCTRCGIPYHDCENPFLRRGTGWKISTGSCRQGELTHRDFRRRVPFRGFTATTPADQKTPAQLKSATRTTGINQRLLSYLQNIEPALIIHTFHTAIHN